jgi:hypothetical protein
MLAPVNVQRKYNLNSPNIVKPMILQNSVIYGQSLNYTQKHKKDVSFAGEEKKKYPSGEYSKEEIKEAKKYIDKTNIETLRDEIFEKKFKQEIESYHQDGALGQIFWAIISFGISVIYTLSEREEARDKAWEHAKKISNLLVDLQNERFNEQAAEAEKVKQNATRKAVFEKQKFDIKENQLKPKFCDLVQREKEKRQTSIPNCIMLVGSNPKVTEELIKWTGRNSNCNFVEINHNDRLLTHLKDARAKYNETGDRTLIHVKGFDQLINPKISPDDKIESLKSIMSQVSEDYHSTIIFSAKDPSKLDQIALQPHRVERIKVDIKTPEEMAVEDAKTRLKVPKREEKAPVATINDLLTVFAPNEEKLKWNPPKAQLRNVEEKLKVLIPSPEENKKDEHFFRLCHKILETAAERMTIDDD